MVGENFGVLLYMDFCVPYWNFWWRGGGVLGNALRPSELCFNGVLIVGWIVVRVVWKGRFWDIFEGLCRGRREGSVRKWCKSMVKNEISESGKILMCSPDKGQHPPPCFSVYSGVNQCFMTYFVSLLVLVKYKTSNILKCL